MVWIFYNYVILDTYTALNNPFYVTKGSDKIWSNFNRNLYVALKLVEALKMHNYSTLCYEHSGVRIKTEEA